MLLIQAKDLEGDGIPHKSAKSICFQGNSFVRGVTFSKRLRHAATELYQEEFAAGNSCLIVDDETHFTLWHQTNEAGQSVTVQADKPEQSPVIDFMQRFVANKRTTLSQPALSTEPSEPSTCRRSANITQSITAASVPAQPSKGANQSTANQLEKSHPSLFQIEPKLALNSVSPTALAAHSHQNPVQDVSALMPDPFSSPYLGPLFIPTSSPYPVASTHQKTI